MDHKPIKSALISVYYKQELGPVVSKLNALGVTLYSTGGTQKFIEDLGFQVSGVETLTGYPSILGGRVKTLHPKVFGGILGRRDQSEDISQLADYEIPEIDLVIVDLYPFEETVAEGAGDQEIIEKIDIGGISLIRAAAKNYRDVLTISSRSQYPELLQLLEQGDGSSSLTERHYFAAAAFNLSSHYDTQIFNFFNREAGIPALKISESNHRKLRYGENPHQEGFYFGDLKNTFDQLNGKELSYNNLVDIESAIALISEFSDHTVFAILKHTNACGIAVGETVAEAYEKAFAADNISAFGGILITNRIVDLPAAEVMYDLFFEVLIAPGYADNALALLVKKKKRILLQLNSRNTPTIQVKSLLDGFIVQERDSHTDQYSDFKTVTDSKPSDQELSDLVFASKVAKHTKSNTIVLAKEGQMLASGVGQTSRVDALNQAIAKARKFGFDLNGSVMASDAFFPFHDCVEIAGKAGVTSVIQPGGSIRDQDSIDYCNRLQMSMVLTGVRHFKH